MEFPQVNTCASCLMSLCWRKIVESGGRRSRMGGWRSATTFLVMLSGVLLIVDLFAAMPGSRAGASASVWLQTMDSCQQALGGAGYQIVSTNGTNFTVSAPAASPVTVNSAAGHCPLQQGNCVSLS